MSGVDENRKTESREMIVLGWDCKKISPARPRDEPPWSLPEDLATDTFRGLDHA